VTKQAEQDNIEEELDIRSGPKAIQEEVEPKVLEPELLE
jgi:hypothetical protein